MSGGPKPILLKGTGVQRRRSRQPKLRKLKKTEKAEKVHKSSDNGNEDKKEGEKKSTALSRHSLSSEGFGGLGRLWGPWRTQGAPVLHRKQEVKKSAALFKEQTLPLPTDQQRSLRQ